MTTIWATLALVIPIIFLYSPRVEQNRIVTISKPLVITQERKTPAYYLYQQAQAAVAPQKIKPIMTTYLSSQNFLPAADSLIAVNEMKISRREIASEADAGFTTKNSTVSPAQKTVYDYQMANTQPATEQVDEQQGKATTKSVLQNTQQQNVKNNNINNPALVNKWATVRGKFELRDGVGIVDHIIEIKRIEEGQVREMGRIDLNAGLYSIDIESPQGYLIAEIKDRNGVSIGVDRQKIINLQSRGQYFEGPFIQVHRPTTGMAANPTNPPSRSNVSVSENKYHPAGNGAKNKTITKTTSAVFKTSLFSNQNVLQKPKDQINNISMGSSTIARVSDLSELYKTVVSVRQTGDENETPIFTTKWIDGVLEYISDIQKIEFKSNKAPLIIGRIMTDNKVIAGAQVQIESHPGLLPIYFDQFMIPNPKQTETSENGYFMFVGLEEENYEVVAFKNNKIIGQQFFITEQDAISYQNISTTSAPTTVTIRTFDAFSSEPIQADVVAPDSEDILETVAGTAIYRTQNNLGISQFLARTNLEGYVPVRYVQDARKEYVHIPMIQEVWLKSLMTARLINEVPNTGIVIGFVPHFDFETYLIFEDYTKDQVIYFDQQGQISESPVHGGGFVMFNVPTGAREVIVQEKESERIYSQVFDIKVNQVSVTHFSE